MKAINALSEAMIYGSLGVVAVLMLLTVGDVTGRYLFNRPIIGTTEITEYLMACLLLGMAPCALLDRHVRVDFVVKRFPQRMQDALDIIFYIAGLVVVGILAGTGLRQSLTALAYNAGSSMLNIPDFPFYIVLVVSYGMLALAMVVLLIRKISEVAKR